MDDEDEDKPQDLNTDNDDHAEPESLIKGQDLNMDDDDDDDEEDDENKSILAKDQDDDDDDEDDDS